jgi:hypothetical protein
MNMISNLLVGVVLAGGLGGGGMAANESATIRASAERPWKDGGTYATCDKASERAAQLQAQGYEARVRQNVFTWNWYVIYR